MEILRGPVKGVESGKDLTPLAVSIHSAFLMCTEVL